jgi:hypothetical protein
MTMMKTEIYSENYRAGGESFSRWSTWYKWTEFCPLDRDENGFPDKIEVRVGIARTKRGDHDLIASIEEIKGGVAVRCRSAVGTRVVLSALECLDLDTGEALALLDKSTRLAITNAYFAETAR